MFITICLITIISGLPDRVLAIINEPLPRDPSTPEGCTADFIVFGDSQGSFGYIWPVASSFDNLVSLLNEIDAPFAVHVGDMYVGDSFLAADVEKQAAVFQKDIAKLDMPMYPVMGNHDAQGDGWAVARNVFFNGNSTYYSFDNGNSHFVILDAYMPDAWSTISSEQLRWLDDDLRSNTKPHVFVFVHAPLYPLGWHKGTSLDLDIELRDRLASLLVEHQVDVIFSGHEHFYASFKYKGLMQVTTGGAGAKLRTPAQLDELIEEYGYTADEIIRWKVVKELHYVCVSTTSTHIEISAYNLEGNLIDQFVLSS